SDGTAPRPAPRASSALRVRHRRARAAPRSAPAPPAPPRTSARSLRARSEPSACDLDLERRPGCGRLAHELLAGADDRVATLERRARRERAQPPVGALEPRSAPLQGE